MNIFFYDSRMKLIFIPNKLLLKKVLVMDILLFILNQIILRSIETIRMVDFFRYIVERRKYFE